MHAKPYMFVTHRRRGGSLFISKIENSQVFHKDGSMWFFDNVAPISKGVKSVWNTIINKLYAIGVLKEV